MDDRQKKREEQKKSFLDEIKAFFMVSEGLSLGEKIKIWWNSGHKF